MSNRIHVASRKGLLTVDRTSGGWQVTKLDFPGQNCSMLLHDGRDNSLYASLNHGHFGNKLHRSDDDGQSWEEVAVPVFPAFTEEDQRRQEEAGEVGARRDFSKLHEIWELTPGGTDQPGVIWAGTIPGGLFRSEDRGTTWQLMESLWNRDDRWAWFGGGKDHPGIHSVTVHPADSNRVGVAISCGGAWFSEDGGTTWEVRGSGLRAEYMPPEQAGDPNIQDPHRMVQCTAQPDAMWIQHHNGIFRSTDAGHNWEEITNAAPSGFGFAVVVHPEHPDTAWFVPGVKDECRIPVDGRFVVTRTRDGGQTFETLDKGLPGEHSYDIVFRHALDIDATGERLVMGSSTGSLWVSENGGDSWDCVSTHLPPIYCARFAN